MNFKNKKVLITGASRGIGKEIAISFANEGYNVIINSSKSANELELVSNIIKQNGGICETFLADVSNYNECKIMFNTIGNIDVLINNAGISYVGLFSDMNEHEWKKIISVNLYSVFNCTNIAIPYMINKKSGTIINISSIWGERGASCEAVYSASKGAINSFTKSMAKELGPSGIRVNAVSCGVIDTNMNDWLNEEEKEEIINDISLMRFGNTNDIAQLCLFIASDKSNFINGQIITIDGCMF